MQYVRLRSLRTRLEQLIKRREQFDRRHPSAVDMHSLLEKHVNDLVRQIRDLDYDYRH